MTSRNKLIAWLATLGAGLLVFGYITADQWLSLLTTVLGSS